MAVSITRTANPAGVSASGMVATYTNVSLGTEASDRIIVVLVGVEKSFVSIDSVTLNGQTMNAGSEGSADPYICARSFYLAYPTGTTATIAVTFGGTLDPTNTENHIAVYRVTGGTYSSTGSDSSLDMDSTDPLTTGAITIPDGGGFIAVAAGRTDTDAKTWTNATEDLDIDAGVFRFTTATRTTALTSTAITCYGTSNGEDGALSYLIFSAASGDVQVNASVQTTTSSLPTPTIIAVKNVTIDASIQALTFSLPTPSVGIFEIAEPNAQTITSSQPTPVVTGDALIEGTAQTIITSLPTPVVTTVQNMTVTVDVQSFTSTLPAPTITTSTDVLVQPTTQALTSSPPAPIIDTTSNVVTTPIVQTITTSLPAPTIITTQDVVVQPSVQTSTLSLPTPTIQTIQNVTVSPDALVIVSSQPTPSISGNALTSVSIQPITLSLPTPTVIAESGNVIVETSVQILVSSQPTPIVSGDSTFETNVQNISVSQPAPSILGEAVIDLTTQVINSSLPSPSVSGSTLVTLSVQSIVFSQPVPEIRGDANVGDVWGVQYEANALPENSTPSWTKNYSPDPLVYSTVEINPAGKLHVVSSSSNPETIDWYIQPAEFSDSVGVTVEFRLKVVEGAVIESQNGNTLISLDTGASYCDLGIYTDGVLLQAQGSNSYEFDTTDDYHTYRITSRNGSVKVYIDGVLRLSDNADIGSSQYIDVFATSGLVDCEQYWDYIYYRTDGAFAPLVQNLSFSLPAPSVTGDTLILADVQSFTASFPSPTITGEAIISPTVQALTFSQPTPTVILGGDVAVYVGAQSLTASQPVILVLGDANISPSVQTLTLSQKLPSISIEQIVSAGVQAFTSTQPSPAVITELNVLIYARVMEIVCSQPRLRVSAFVPKYEPQGNTFSDKYSQKGTGWVDKYEKQVVILE